MFLGHSDCGSNQEKCPTATPFFESVGLEISWNEECLRIKLLPISEIVAEIESGLKLLVTFIS